MNFTSTYKQLEYDKLRQTLTNLGLGDDDVLAGLFESGWEKIEAHGDFPRWSAGLSELPNIDEADACFSTKVEVSSGLVPAAAKESVKDALKMLHPWRKGPFDVFGVDINTEWRSDWKWDRVVPHISPLKDKVVLDIGCGSGYHLWRIMGQGAKLGLGIDPTPLFSFHFASIKRYQPQVSAFLIPAGIDEMPDAMACFDTVFSMGILYHRREPLEHLYKIKSLLKEGGELVLETLVVEGDETTCLMPTARYAKMRNVWFIPSVAMLKIWLQRVGFKDVRCVDINTTSTQEQRSTEWMNFESLDDFLDPNDKNKTVEGYQAPQRAVMVARR